MGVKAPGKTTTSFFIANSTTSRTSPGLVKNFAPASKQRLAVSTSNTVPAPTIISGMLFVRSVISSIAPGTVIVISAMGIPPRLTDSAAKRASAAEAARTPGIMPISTIRDRISSFFTGPTPSRFAWSLHFRVDWHDPAPTYLDVQGIASFPLSLRCLVKCHLRHGQFVAVSGDPRI